MARVLSVRRAAIAVLAAGFVQSAAAQTAMNKPDAARALIDKAVAAKGGLRKLQSIRTIHSESTTAYGTSEPFKTVTWIAYPDRYRIEADLPAGTVVQVYAGGQYWIQDANGSREAPDSTPIKESLQRDTIPLLLKLSSGALTVRAVDTADQSLAGLEISGEGMTPLTMFVNRMTGLIAGVRYESASDPGVLTEEIYGDYRDVDGVQIPFATTVRRTGGTPIARDVKTFRMNLSVPAALFVKPR